MLRAMLGFRCLTVIGGVVNRLDYAADAQNEYSFTFLILGAVQNIEQIPSCLVRD